MNPTSKKPSYVFFGSAEFSVIVLDEMEKAGFTPSLIVTTPDKPKGRTLVLTPTPVKTWGLAHDIPVLDPAKLDPFFIETLIKKINEAAKMQTPIQLFVVAAYGKIIPQPILDLPAHQTLNIHPSLLPLYRGAAPLQSAMLDDAKDTGVTIMRIDALMDHGPIVAQKKISVSEWPTYEAFEEMMARAGGQLLAEVMPDWVSGKIKEREQDHAAATATRKFIKEDGLIDIEKITGSATVSSSSVAEQYDIFRKIQAFHLWPSVYFFIEKKNGASNTALSSAAGADNITRKIRVKVTAAEWADGKLVIKKVVPEGKSETDFTLFMRSVRSG